ncbi:HisA/HisF-related TIM barrel protein [Deinococcus lacus]|uniref:1-(5-phosphoribosyl)-5-[(5-phosphoribosylamino)methylideneamino] imidazole-4-carboxamide isomerase n=1 Tax=Deinococcus lacus TaxID=392561 RepID=A0ABW1YHE5_9DEIO
MIIPALDLLDGQVVRLYQGDFSQKTVFDADPLVTARAYQEAGAHLLHVVDLSGAQDPACRQVDLLSGLAARLSLPVQVGGGIRRGEEIEALLNAGALRVVVGSAAIADPGQLAGWLREFGAEQLVVALDLRLDAGRRTLAVSGWQEDACELGEFFAALQALGAGPRHVLCTDISCDGTLRGPNLALYSDLTRQYPQLAWQASGGVSELGDVAALRQTGVAGAVVGRALLTGALDFAQAQQIWEAGS